MPSNPNSLNELITLITQYGLSTILQSSHLLVGVLDSNGNVVSSNPPFEIFKQNLPGSTTLRELVIPSAQTEFDKILLDTRRTNKMSQTKLELGSQAYASLYDCMIIPIEEGSFLFFCEPISFAADVMRVQNLEA